MAQRSIVVYSGLNITNTTYHLDDDNNEFDTTYMLGNTQLLPHLGMDINFPFSEHFYITTGLGVNLMGSKNYNDTIPEGINLDHNLRLNYIKVPLLINVGIGSNISLFGGYSLNYCYRKNQNFFAADIVNQTIDNIFNDFHHTLILGLKLKLNSISLFFNYNKGLNRVWDTRDFYTSSRSFLKMEGYQISLGYLISDNK